MQIYDMFADDINRKINGVIQVEQSDDDVIEQELHEYVITNELKKHFMSFFSYYSDAFDTPTADTGVWISGFFDLLRCTAVANGIPHGSLISRGNHIIADAVVIVLLHTYLRSRNGMRIL